MLSFIKRVTSSNGAYNLIRHQYCNINSGNIKQRTFKTIGTALNLHDKNEVQLRYDLSIELNQKLNTLTEFALAGGGDKAVKRHVEKNKKLLVRDRIKRLLDPSSTFIEFSLLAGLDLYGTNVQGAGTVCGIGKVNGKDVMVIANDATVSGGAAYPISVAKSLRAQEIALENRLPCFYIVDSAGAFLPMQSEIFPDKNHGGRWFYNQARMSSIDIPQIAIISGSCTAGGAYMCTMSDEAVIVKDLGKVFLGGPPLVKAATGEIVSELELGGADLHTKLSGCTDHFAENEEEAFEIARFIAETLPDRKLSWIGHEQSRYYNMANENNNSKNNSNVNDNNNNNNKGIPPKFDTNELLSIASRTNENERINMLEALARIVDGSKLHEHRSNYGETLITGWARIEGILVGIIANNGPLVEGTYEKFEKKNGIENVGASACPAALKGSHFIRLCEQKEIPLIYFVDTDDTDDIRYGGKNVGVMKDIAKMMQVGNSTALPKITIVCGRNTGPSSFAMSPSSSSPTFLLSWPHARSGIEGSFYDSFYGTSRMWDDGIISPIETREKLGDLLRIIVKA